MTHTVEASDTRTDPTEMQCPKCGQELVVRHPGTPEQAWCGVWLEHATRSLAGCRSTTLIPSPELSKLYEDMRVA